MRPTSDSSNPEYSPRAEAFALTRRLDALMQANNGDGEEADGVRDALDLIWAKQLTRADQELVRALSGDLYTLWDPRPDVAPATPGAEAHLRALIDRQAWPDVLAFLHQEPAVVSPAHAMRLRGRAWRALGEPAIARLFTAEIEKALSAGASSNS